MPQLYDSVRCAIAWFYLYKSHFRWVSFANEFAQNCWWIRNRSLWSAMIGRPMFVWNNSFFIVQEAHTVVSNANKDWNVTRESMLKINGGISHEILIDWFRFQWKMGEFHLATTFFGFWLQQFLSICLMRETQLLFYRDIGRMWRTLSRFFHHRFHEFSRFVDCEHFSTILQFRKISKRNFTFILSPVFEFGHTIHRSYEHVFREKKIWDFAYDYTFWTKWQKNRLEKKLIFSEELISDSLMDVKFSVFRN